MAKQSMVDTIKAARRTAVPLVAVATADQWAAESLLREQVFAKGTSKSYPDPVPEFRWDAVRGLQHLNALAEAYLAKMPDPQKKASFQPAAALAFALDFPKHSVLFFHNAQAVLGQNVVYQAVSNLRDAYKEDTRILVMLGTQFSLPDTLVPDVVTVDEALPSEAQLGEILDELHRGVELPLPEGQTRSRAIDAGRGLSAFAAETVYCLSIGPKGLDAESVWDRKVAQVNQTPGLKMMRSTARFAELGGLEFACEMGRQLANSPDGLSLVVLLDEVEKMMAGSAGDTSGVSQDALGVILREMEENGADGLVSVSPAGCGKTQFAKALAGEAGVPLLTMDLGAMKAGRVGESEARVRAAMRTVWHVGGRGVFFIATCNSLTVLPPELRRRFRSGIMYFDLPSPAERLAIWPIHLKAFGIDVKPEAADKLVNATDWTGAEIRNVCERAWKLKLPLEQAANYIVPVIKSDPAKVEALRNEAKGRFLCANYAGAYQGPKVDVPAGGPKRALTLQ